TMVCLASTASWAGAEAARERPPAPVVTAPVTDTVLKPKTEIKGNVFFKEVSELATEVSGQVLEVLFEEGQRVTAGTPMVRLDATLLESELVAARARLDQSVADLEQEKTRFERAVQLLKDEVTTPQQYDDLRFTVESLDHRVAANRAEIQLLQRTIAKKTTKVPFDGIVIERLTELGEWKRDGETVAVVARARLYDVIVNVKEDDVTWVRPGDAAEVRVGDRRFDGTIVTVIPRGDMVTQTFPVKVRIEHENGLYEGMSAFVKLPSGAETKCLQVPRDGVITDRGQTVVFTVNEGAAVRCPVEVIGFQGLMAGVMGDGLKPGMAVIVKGNERLRDGQAVAVSE
ncbi:MAG: efflux RND transporter periplasmic adaptor subunit, partial [bacterium]|nr:efflux RND transporter periplasmic adaptor subunit [bacterium]